MKTLAVDFDGVIHKYSMGWHDGTIYDVPNDGAIAGLELLMQKYCVVIHTARDKAQVRDWLKQYGFNVVASNDISWWTIPNALLVTNIKPGAIAYIDDRAHVFYNWDEVLDRFLKEKK